MKHSRVISLRWRYEGSVPFFTFVAIIGAICGSLHAIARCTTAQFHAFQAALPMLAGISRYVFSEDSARLY